MGDLEVFFTDPVFIDLEVYALWLKGYTDDEATQRRQASSCLSYLGASPAIIASDTRDQYRVFQMLDHFLQTPPLLRKQMLLQIPHQTQQILIERYYEFDKVMIRELLGKKLTARLRKDLDDISEKTKVSLKSCRRQFDNIKNVYKVVEDMEGRLVQNIQKHFLLSEELARQYACIVFMANYRFETGKRRLAHLTFDDFAYCAEKMIEHWTVGSQGSDLDDMDIEFDREFLQDVRDLKVIHTDNKVLEQQKNLVCDELQSKFSKKTLKTLDSNFKMLSRILCNIVASLVHHKDLKDFFVDIMEKIIEPCKQMDWQTKEVDMFLRALIDSADRLEILKRLHGQKVVSVYVRAMNVMHLCIVQMYSS